MRTASLADVLAARDKRQQLQQQLLAHGTVISLTVLAVGEQKRSAFLDELLAAGKAAVLATLATKGIVVVAEQDLDALGGAAWVCAVSAKPRQVKAEMLKLEEASPIGRLWDIDVLDAAGVPLSRTAFAKAPRRCLCCDEDAKVCARARRHSVADILQVMQARAAAYARCVAIGQAMAEALMAEVRLTPKPGLVDRDNCGPHPDMTLADFENSATALAPYFTAFAALGCTQAASPALLPALREIGLAAEQAMWQATGGVNTHKGAIFALGLWAAALMSIHGAAAHAQYLQATQPVAVADICAAVKAISADLAAEYGKGETAGAALYRAHGLTGARGEAVRGFSTITTVALPAYQQAFAQTQQREHALRYALLHLFAYNDDTTTVHRGGMEGLLWLQQTARALLTRAELLTDAEALIGELKQLDKQCTAKNLSTGGSADLLALTLFITSFEQ